MANLKIAKFVMKLATFNASGSGVVRLNANTSEWGAHRRQRDTVRLEAALRHWHSSPFHRL
jgi:hypothetical protein